MVRLHRSHHPQGTEPTYVRSANRLDMFKPMTSRCTWYRIQLLRSLDSIQCHTNTTVPDRVDHDLPTSSIQQFNDSVQVLLARFR